ncbi:hypothetical protein [Mucilaginibacter lappiensis]|uniref:hypothetical protein n=1 Tax=Mucilaginibacter lappiensis TaxID=354630 RepID=UPI003D2268C0
MIRNYFKTTLRALVKNKAFSFLNIAGLATSGVLNILIAALINPVKSLRSE